MAKFVQIEGQGGHLVHVNPERIAYLHDSGERTKIHFEENWAILVEEPISKVLQYLQRDFSR